jgi:phage terminase Nu1 subunit (DNA packaging protein)
MAAEQPELVVTEADQALAKRFWRIHPNELQEMGLYREQFYAREIAKHRLSSEQAAAQRALEMAAEVAQGKYADHPSTTMRAHNYKHAGRRIADAIRSIPLSDVVGKTDA